MDNVEHVVKVEFHRPLSTGHNNVCEAFSRCGAIRDVHSSGSRSPADIYFIEFSDEGSVVSALRTQIVEGVPVTVRSCRDDRTSRDEYRDLYHKKARRHSNSVSKRKRGTSPSSTNERAAADHFTKRTRQSSGSRSAYISPSPACPPLPCSSKDDFSTSLAQSLKIQDLRISNRPPLVDRSDTNVGRSTSPLLPLSPLPIRCIHLPSPIPMLPSPASPSPSPERRSFISSFDTRIHLSFCGEIITFDLEALDDDPAGIIAMLKATSSERDKWMMAAAHYRRRHNSSAAHTVVSVMIEVLSELGIAENELKPAYLMLAGCENDLARLSPPGSATYQQHASNAADWLRRVYGAFEPPIKSNNALGLSLDAHHDDTSDDLHIPFQSVLVPEGCKAIPSVTSGRVASSNSGSTASIVSSRLATSLQDEVESLRGHLQRTTDLLASAHAVNKDLEQELSAERLARRRAENHIALLGDRCAVSNSGPQGHDSTVFHHRRK